MTEYQASNGIKVDSETQGITGRRRITFHHGNHGTLVEMSAEEAVALIESLDHEKDEELGRWRDPDNPRLTVYPTEGYETDEITILDDVDAETYTITRARAERSQGGWWHDTAKAYFEAHPERKPWHDAKPGEVWVLTFDGADDTFKAYESRYGTIYFTRSRETSTNLTNERITAGRRIWPEDAS